jgi:DNA repair protein RadC
MIKLFELKKVQTEFPSVKVNTSKISYDFIKKFYSGDIEVYESFFILLLNRANKTVGYAKISQGGVVGTYVDIKIIAKYAVDSLASSVILAHNHPGGNTAPSEQDKSITQRIKKALALLDVQVFDHIILTEDSYYSFADEGIL